MEQEETEQTEAGLEFSTLSEANTDSPLGEPRKLHIKDSLPPPEILCSLGFLLCNFIKTAERRGATGRLRMPAAVPEEE